MLCMMVAFVVIATTLSVYCGRRARLYSLKASSYRDLEETYEGVLENDMLHVHTMSDEAVKSREKAKTKRHSPPGITLSDTVEGLLAWASVCEADAAQHSFSAKADQVRLDYLRSMRRKYEYAAAHPWLPVSQDKPPPYPINVSDSR